MCHQLAKEYGWSKSQVDETYPQEAIIMLKFIAYEHRDKELSEQIEYYRNLGNLVSVQHADKPGELRDSWIKAIEQIQNLKVAKVTPAIDDDMPDFARIKELKDSLKQQKEKMR